MRLPLFRSRRLLAGAVAVAAAIVIIVSQFAFGSTTPASAHGADWGGGGSAKGLGQLSGFLPRASSPWAAPSTSTSATRRRDFPFTRASPTKAHRSRRRCGTSSWTPPTPDWLPTSA